MKPLLLILFVFAIYNLSFTSTNGDLFNEEYEFNGKTIIVKELENDKYVIEFPIDNVIVKKDGDLGGLGIYNVWVTDFDKDNNPEIILFWKETGTGAYATLLFHELTDEGLIAKDLPKMNKAVYKYYRGKDFYKVTDSEIIHEFPAYNENDPNAAPTAGNVIIYYNYSKKILAESGYKLFPPSEKSQNDKPELKIIKITGLAKYDKLSHSDTFVEIYLKDILIGKTKVIKDSPSPVFNESFFVAETEISDITIKIFDKDIRNNDIIGEVNIKEINSGTYPIMKANKDGSIKKVAEIEIEFISK